MFPNFFFSKTRGLRTRPIWASPRRLRLHLAFGWCGDMQVELIQPIAGVSTYSKFLDHNPQGGIHHYGIEIANYAAGREGDGSDRLSRWSRAGGTTKRGSPISTRPA